MWSEALSSGSRQPTRSNGALGGVRRIEHRVNALEPGMAFYQGPHHLDSVRAGSALGASMLQELLLHTPTRSQK